MIDIQVQLPVTAENLEEAYEQIFAPWVKTMGLTEIEISKGKASALLPQSTSPQWANGAICGHVDY